MRLCDDPDRKGVMKGLKKTVGIRLGNMSRQTAVTGLVIESERGKYQRCPCCKRKGDVLEINVCHTKPRILDLSLAIMPRHRRLSVDREFVRRSKTQLRYHG
jgi:hypothetical protein